jgi:ornithine carbamoyltransferase
MKRDLVSFALWTSDEILEILDLARNPGTPSARPLHGKTAALVFERESLRTRVSFEVGIAELGGHPVFLQQQTIGIATRESVHDVAVALSQYCPLIVARTAKHQTCVQLAESAAVPVINAMTDLLHPCQILADAFTLQGLGRLNSRTKIVFTGDGNNIANSLLELAEKLPLQLVISCPQGYEPHPGILDQAIGANVSSIKVIHDPKEAVHDADVVYTDKWSQAEDPGERQRRLSIFRPYQVNKSLLRRARSGCVVMHRLPANRGEEITGDVLDGKQCIALEQARNRLEVQKAVMTKLLR